MPSGKISPVKAAGAVGVVVDSVVVLAAAMMTVLVDMGAQGGAAVGRQPMEDTTEPLLPAPLLTSSNIQQPRFAVDLVNIQTLFAVYLLTTCMCAR